jgi:hypothetical protein
MGAIRNRPEWLFFYTREDADLYRNLLDSLTRQIVSHTEILVI